MNTTALSPQSSPKSRQLFDSSCGFSLRITGYFRKRYGTQWVNIVSSHAPISHETLKRIEERGSVPSLLTFIKLLNFAGPECLAALFEQPPDWLNDAKERERLLSLEGRIVALLDDLQKMRLSHD
jgi:hypothetical protein